MKSELKKTRQYFRSIGTVYELGLKLEDCEIKLKDKEGNDAGKMDGERIMGNVSLRTKNGIHTFNVYFQSHNSDSKENIRWKMANEMLKWNPEVNGDGEAPTRVTIEGTVSINDYVKDGKVYTNLRWRVGKASTKVSEDEETGTTLEATCYVHKIVPELTKNEEETERLAVTFMCADNNGACFPINGFVNEDLVDDFSELIEEGHTHPFTFDLITKHIGETKKETKRALGRAGSVQVNQGFDIEEVIVVGADEAIEEPDDLGEDENGNPIEDNSGYIDPSVMKKAIKIRAQMLQELIDNPPASNSGGKKYETFKDKKAKATKSVGKGGGSKKDSVPFDVDDDEDIF